MSKRKKRADCEQEERVARIALEIKRLHPGTRMSTARREARAIAKHRDHYRVTAEEKSIKGGIRRKEKAPEHIKRTMSRQARAEEERRSRGRALPKASIVPGGRTGSR